MFGRLRRLLEEGRPAFGSWVTIGNPEVTEILSLLGFDWLLIDMEHAPIDYQLLEHMLMPISGDVTPLVRVPFNNPVYVKRVLDMGVAGVLFPLVSSKAEAELAVKSTRYPPKGIRGVGARRASKYGLRRKEYYEIAENVIVIVQIETVKAVENFEDIVSVEGVDAFFIGPNDLSFSLGCRSWKEEKVRQTIEKLAETAKSMGVPGGMYCGNEEALRFALDIGFQFIALGSDVRSLIRGAREILEYARKYAEKIG